MNQKFRTSRNRKDRIGLLAYPVASHCWLLSRTLLARSLAHSVTNGLRSHDRSLTRSLLSSWDSGIFLSNFQGLLNHCGIAGTISASSISILLLKVQTLDAGS